MVPFPKQAPRDLPAGVVTVSLPYPLGTPGVIFARILLLVQLKMEFEGKEKPLKDKVPVVPKPNPSILMVLPTSTLLGVTAKTAGSSNRSGWRELLRFMRPSVTAFREKTGAPALLSSAPFSNIALILSQTYPGYLDQPVNLPRNDSLE